MPEKIEEYDYVIAELVTEAMLGPATSERNWLLITLNSTDNCDAIYC